MLPFLVQTGMPRWRGNVAIPGSYLITAMP